MCNIRMTGDRGAAGECTGPLLKAIVDNSGKEKPE